MKTAARILDAVLQAVTLGLLVLLAAIVVLAVAFRYSGNSLIWYDEAASVLLAWLTFTGAGLAALRNAHLSFDGLLYALPQAARRVLFALVEVVFVASFAIIAWAGWRILAIFGAESLISLPFVPLWFTKAVLPAAALVVIAARLLTLPERWHDVALGLTPEAREIAQEVERAQREQQRGFGQPPV